MHINILSSSTKGVLFMYYDVIHHYLETQIERLLEGTNCSAAAKNAIYALAVKDSFEALSVEARMFDIADNGEYASIIAYGIEDDKFKPDAEIALSFVTRLRMINALQHRAEKALEPDPGNVLEAVACLMAGVTNGLPLRPCEEDMTMLLDAVEAIRDHAKFWLDGSDEHEELPDIIYGLIGNELVVAQAFCGGVNSIVNISIPVVKFKGDAEAVVGRVERLLGEIGEMIDLVNEALPDNEDDSCDCCGCSHCDCGGES